MYFSDPNIGHDGPSSLTPWPEYDTTSQRYIRFRADVKPLPVEHHYAAARVHFWNELVPVLQDNCDKKCQPCQNQTLHQPVIIG